MVSIEFHPSTRFHIPAFLIEDIGIWVHEFTEDALKNWLKKNNLSRFTEDVIGCSIVGLEAWTSLNHLVTTLHTMTFVNIDGTLMRFTGEEFAEKMSFNGAKMQ
jgi:hypothetical protein